MSKKITLEITVEAADILLEGIGWVRNEIPPSPTGRDKGRDRIAKQLTQYIGEKLVNDGEWFTPGSFEQFKRLYEECAPGETFMFVIGGQEQEILKEFAKYVIEHVEQGKRP